MKFLDSFREDKNLWYFNNLIIDGGLNILYYVLFHLKILESPGKFAKSSSTRDYDIDKKQDICWLKLHWLSQNSMHVILEWNLYINYVIDTSYSDCLNQMKSVLYRSRSKLRLRHSKLLTQTGKLSRKGVLLCLDDPNFGYGSSPIQAPVPMSIQILGSYRQTHQILLSGIQKS